MVSPGKVLVDTSLIVPAFGAGPDADPDHCVRCRMAIRRISDLSGEICISAVSLAELGFRTSIEPVIAIKGVRTYAFGDEELEMLAKLRDTSKLSVPSLPADEKRIFIKKDVQIVLTALAKGAKLLSGDGGQVNRMRSFGGTAYMIGEFLSAFPEQMKML